MSRTILQRLQALADAPASPVYAKAASVLRKLATTDDAVEKAHVVAGIVKGLDAADQERVVAAVEVLAALPKS